jgi:hypothetical protein
MEPQPAARERRSEAWRRAARVRFMMPGKRRSGRDLTPGPAEGDRGRASGLPRAVEEDDAVPVGILERDPASVPIGVRRWDGLMAVGSHSLDGAPVLARVGEVEDEEVLPRRSAPGCVASLQGEFEVIALADLAQHNAVEALVVLNEPISLRPRPSR